MVNKIQKEKRKQKRRAAAAAAAAAAPQRTVGAKKTGLAPAIFHKAIKVKKIKLENQVLPRLHEGKKISPEESYNLLQKPNPTKRQFVPNLVYHPDQAPTRFDKRGWSWVIKPPKNGKKWVYRLHCDEEEYGYVLVQFLGKEEKLSQSITKGVEYFLEKCSPVRTEFEYEKGEMVGAGLRFEKKTSCVVSFDDKTGDQDEVEFNNLKKHCLKDFCQLFECASTHFSDDYNRSFEYLKSVGNYTTVKFKRRRDVDYKKEIMPTYAVSKDLCNSRHIDINDSSRSYAVFYGGLSYLVFPCIGAAILISERPVLVSWYGLKQPHCTIRVKKGTRSLFTCGNIDVERAKTIETVLKDERGNSEKSKRKCLEEGEEVYAEEMVWEAKLNPNINLEKYSFDHYSIRKGKVVEKEDDDVVEVEYKSKAGKEYKPVKLPKTRVLSLNEYNNLKRRHEVEVAYRTPIIRAKKRTNPYEEKMKEHQGKRKAAAKKKTITKKTATRKKTVKKWTRQRK